MSRFRCPSCAVKAKPEIEELYPKIAAFEKGFLRTRRELLRRRLDNLKKIVILEKMAQAQESSDANELVAGLYDLNYLKNIYRKISNVIIFIDSLVD